MDITLTVIGLLLDFIGAIVILAPDLGLVSTEDDHMRNLDGIAEVLYSDWGSGTTSISDADERFRYLADIVEARIGLRPINVQMVVTNGVADKLVFEFPSPGPANPSMEIGNPSALADWIRQEKAERRAAIRTKYLVWGAVALGLGFLLQLLDNIVIAAPTA